MRLGCGTTICTFICKFDSIFCVVLFFWFVSLLFRQLLLCLRRVICLSTSCSWRPRGAGPTLLASTACRTIAWQPGVQTSTDRNPPMPARPGARDSPGGRTGSPPGFTQPPMPPPRTLSAGRQLRAGPFSMPTARCPTVADFAAHQIRGGAAALHTVARTQRTPKWCAKISKNGFPLFQK